MHTIKTVVIDDESFARKRIVQLLSRHSEFELIDQCDNGDDAYVVIMEKQPEVIFLDIEMPVLSGIELIEKLPKVHRPFIVFVTAYNDYAIQAFDFFALDYLLKPFTEKRFDTTIERIKRMIQNERKKETASQINAFLEFLNNKTESEKTIKKRLPIPIGNKIYFIEVDDIQYVVASGNYVHVFVNNTKHVLRETLSSFEQKLERDEFVRIHKSFIVNTAFVREIKKTSTGNIMICMNNNETFKVSKTYKSEVLKKLL